MHKNNPSSKRENVFRKLYEDKGFKDVLNSRSAPATFPFLVDIELTNHCNLSCIFCAQWIMERKKGFMEWGVFKKVVDECAERNAPIRFIRYGEPFLHKEILRFCSYVKQKELPLHITNNGLVVNESHMRALVDMEVDSIIFSFQGATREQYELMRNNDSYDKLVSNIMKIVELRGDREKPYIHISSTMTDESRSEIQDFIDRWAGIADSVGVGKTKIDHFSENQLMSLSTSEKLMSLKERSTISNVYRPCREVYQKLSVDWDGKITCCCGDYDNFMVVGDAAVSSLFDIWNQSESLKRFRGMLDKNMHKALPLCSTCYHAYEDF